MFKFTKTGIFCVLIIIMFILLQIIIHKNTFQIEIKQEIMKEIQEKPVIHEMKKTEIWQIEIPQISLNTEITEGTTNEIIKYKAGHFESTSIKQGNIGLAVICKDLKKIQKGDEIIYRYNEFQKIYEVEKCRIIRENEWDYLEETEDNRLTIITYIENYAEYRRCIQAVEKEEE